MELAEVLQGLFSRKRPGNTSCDAFLHFNSLIRAQPNGSWLTSSSTTLSSPPGSLGFGWREEAITLPVWDPAPDRGSCKRSLQMNICFLLPYFSPSNDSHLSFLRHYLVWGCTMQAGCVQMKQHQVFRSPGYFCCFHFLVKTSLGLQEVLSHSASEVRCFQHHLLVPLCL